MVPNRSGCKVPSVTIQVTHHLGQDSCKLLLREEVLHNPRGSFWSHLAQFGERGPFVDNAEKHAATGQRGGVKTNTWVTQTLQVKALRLEGPFGASVDGDLAMSEQLYRAIVRSGDETFRGVVGAHCECVHRSQRRVEKCFALRIISSHPDSLSLLSFLPLLLPEQPRKLPLAAAVAQRPAHDEVDWVDDVYENTAH